MDPAIGPRVLALVVIVSGLVGLVVGSFLNVVVYRLPLGMSVARPPSSCPGCGTELAPRDNVPIVSWLLLRARCRYCRAPISPRYPLVELATGAGFAGIAWSLWSLRPLPGLLLVWISMVAGAAMDLDRSPLPWTVQLPGWFGSLWLVAVAVAADRPGRIAWGAAGAAACVLVALGTDRSARGPGRAGAAAVLGWSAGWLWPAGGLVLAAWVLALALGGAATGRRDRRDRRNRRDRDRRDGDRRERAPGTRAPTGPALWPVVAGGFGLLLAGALLGRPL